LKPDFQHPAYSICIVLLNIADLQSPVLYSVGFLWVIAKENTQSAHECYKDTTDACHIAVMPLQE
jgi:hypothetical protein